MYIKTEQEQALFRALGFLDGIAATTKDDTVRAAIYDAIEQLENALSAEGDT